MSNFNSVTDYISLFLTNIILVPFHVAGWGSVTIYHMCSPLTNEGFFPTAAHLTSLNVTHPCALFISFGYLMMLSVSILHGIRLLNE
jgi:hypothetical protein